jgi:hypothetical protein
MHLSSQQPIHRFAELSADCQKDRQLVPFPRVPALKRTSPRRLQVVIRLKDEPADEG